MHYGPLPPPPDIAPGDVHGFTSEQTALHHLVTVHRWTGEDDDYNRPDGWHRFDREEAVTLTASIVDDLLTYLHDALGPAAVDDALRRSIDNHRAATGNDTPSPLPACVHYREPDPTRGEDCIEQQIADAYVQLVTDNPDITPFPEDEADAQAARDALHVFVAAMSDDPADQRPTRIRLINALMRNELRDGDDPEASAADVLADVICGMGRIVSEEAR